MILLLKFLLAHFIGDFLLQPKRWVEQKEKKKLKSWELYAHGLIHFLLIVALTWELELLVPALVIAVSHLVIDANKIMWQNPQTMRRWFLADQLLHLVVIATTWLYMEDFPITLSDFNTRNSWLVVTAVVFITTPTSVLVKTLISQWTPKSIKGISADSLPEAGKFIGILERLFILAFIATNHWEAVGFLLAAKSVFRFGDLKDAHDRKLTEYVLIGTLLSFGIAVVTGLLLYYFLDSGVEKIDFFFPM